MEKQTVTTKMYEETAKETYVEGQLKLEFNLFLGYLMANSDAQTLQSQYISIKENLEKIIIDRRTFEREAEEIGDQN